MKYPTYPTYKPSRSEWLGDIPEHWQVKRGRFCMELNPRVRQLQKLKKDDEVSFIPMEALGEYGGLNLDLTRQIGDASNGYTEFQEGDIVVAKITPCFENGKGALVSGLKNGVALGTTELTVLRVQPGLERRFLFYVTISSIYRKAGEAEMHGAGGQKRVPTEFNKNFRLPIPSPHEQRIIASFLDAETAKLDTLLAKKQALIKKLKEKRSALISQIVTRGLPPEAARAAGLDPHPKLEPSGVNWIGDIPKHWKTKRLGYLASKVGSGKTPRGGAEVYQPEGVMLIRSQNVHDMGLRLADMVFISESVDEEMAGTRVIPGDILLNITGASLGRCAIAPRDLPRSNVNQHVCIVRLQPSKALPEFVQHEMTSLAIQSQIFSFENGSSREGLNFLQVKSLQLAVPPLPEQRVIADYLDYEVAKLDQMAIKMGVAIKRLKEYRSTLISATVTGKIDIRGATA